MAKVKVSGQWYTSDPCYGGVPCEQGHQSGARARGQEAISRSRGRQTRGLLERMAQAEVNRAMRDEIARAQGGRDSWGNTDRSC